MEVECSNLSGHRACVTDFEGLLAEAARTRRSNELGELGALGEDPGRHVLVVQSIVAVQLLTSIIPKSTYHAVMGQEVPNGRVVSQALPLFLQNDLPQLWPEILLCDQEIIVQGPLEVQRPCCGFVFQVWTLRRS